MAWFQDLQPASFRGIPFGVFGARGSFGRRVALHEYPFRNSPWPEDVGRKTRVFNVVGFLLENDIITSQGDVVAQVKNMIAAAETNSTGTLIHPTLGSMQVQLLDLDTEEAWNQGRMIRLSLRFVEAGVKVFPSTTVSTTVVGQQSALAAFNGIAIDFQTSITSLYLKGAAIVQQVQGTVNLWVRQAQDVVNDATNVYNYVSTLPQTVAGMYGRYFGGANVGGFNSPVLTQNPTITVETLIGQGNAAQTNAANAFATLATTAAGDDPVALSTAAQNSVAAIIAAAPNPLDAIRALLVLLEFVTPQYSTTAPIGTSINAATAAMGDLLRRSVAIALAQAALSYQPSSYNDAIYVRGLVFDALDNEIEIAGNEFDDNTFTTLRALQAAVAQDLTARGADLAPIATFTSKSPIPAPVWAYRLYRDVTRSDQIVSLVNPIHPAFMPVSFQALSS